MINPPRAMVAYVSEIEKTVRVCIGTSFVDVEHKNIKFFCESILELINDKEDGTTEVVGFLRLELSGL